MRVAGDEWVFTVPGSGSIPEFTVRLPVKMTPDVLGNVWASEIVRQANAAFAAAATST